MAKTPPSPPDAPLDAPLEIELKLRADPEVLARLRRSRVIKRLTQGQPDTRQLLSTYYDTPDFALRRAGVTLRVRREEGRLIQAAKRSAGPAGAKLKRVEFETELDDATPWPAPVPDPDMQRLIGEAVVSGRLHPLFRTDVRRITRDIVTEAGERIELAVDAGEIRRADSDRVIGTIAEIELELVEGAPASLYQLALPLAEAYPVRLGAEAKADRAFRLLLGRAPRALKAEKPVLPPAILAEGALIRFLESAATQIVGNVDAILDAGAPEGVHQMRVGLRRLRAVGALYRRAIDKDALADIFEEARALARALGRARDLDVFAAETLDPVLAAGAGVEGLEQLAERAEAARRSAWAEARDKIGGPEFVRFALNLSRIIDERAWRSGDKDRRKRLSGSARAFAADALDRRWKKARRLGADLGALKPLQRHALRIELKKLRYASDFFGSLFPPEDTRLFRRRLSALQDDFGILNDAHTAAALAADLAASPGDHADPSQNTPDLSVAAGYVAGWRGRAAQAVWTDAQARWAKLVDTKPFWRD